MDNEKRQDEPKKVDLRIIKTKAALRKALLELMEDIPIEKITVSALTRQASVNRKTFYLHYTSIENMIECMVAESVEDISARVEAESDAKTLKEWVSGFSVCLLESVHEILGPDNGLINRAKLPSAFILLHDPILAVTKRELNRLGFADAVDTEFFSINVVYWVSAILGSYVEWRSHGKVSFEEFCQFISRCTLTGTSATYTVL